MCIDTSNGTLVSGRYGPPHLEPVSPSRVTGVSAVGVRGGAQCQWQTVAAMAAGPQPAQSLRLIVRASPSYFIHLKINATEKLYPKVKKAFVI